MRPAAAGLTSVKTALEAALHRRFDDQRVNMANRRKEYFRATLDEIRRAFSEEHGIVSFTLEPDAEEYWQTEAMHREEALGESSMRA